MPQGRVLSLNRCTVATVVATVRRRSELARAAIRLLPATKLRLRRTERSDRDCRALAARRDRLWKRTLLLSIHCFDQPSKFLVTARFCFDENERLAVRADDVDLAAAPIFEIAEKNFVALIPQESTTQFFSARTASEMFRQFLRAREAVAPPVRRSGDGSDRVQIHEVSRDAARCCSPCVARNNTREIARRSCP